MKFREIIFSLTPLILLLLILEIGLRFIHFQYSDMPLVMENKGSPVSMAEVASHSSTQSFSKKELEFKKDRDQFWVPRVSRIEGKYSLEKPEGVKRIATLGCSCTWGCMDTTDSYPSLLESFLNGMSPDYKYQVLNAGVGCYSSYQGIQRLKHVVLNYHPDIVTIFFGWNDHWVSQISDKDIRRRSDLQIFFINLAEYFRIYHAMHWLWDSLRGVVLGKNLTTKKLLPRVEPEDYEANLKEMIRLIIEKNAIPVLVTAPMDPEQIDKPSWVFPIAEPGLLPQIHTFYNSIVRKVAIENHVPLIDLEEEVEFLRKSDATRAAALFSDGIHYTPEGCTIIAKLFFWGLLNLGLLWT